MDVDICPKNVNFGRIFSCFKEDEFKKMSTYNWLTLFGGRTSISIDLYALGVADLCCIKNGQFARIFGVLMQNVEQKKFTLDLNDENDISIINETLGYIRPYDKDGKDADMDQEAILTLAGSIGNKIGIDAESYNHAEIRNEIAVFKKCSGAE